MKKLIIILFLLPLFCKAQELDTVVFHMNNIIESLDTPHVHYFKRTDLPQCDMGNGMVCAVAHFKFSDCVCGAKPTIENLFPGMKIIDLSPKKDKEVTRKNK